MTRDTIMLKLLQAIILLQALSHMQVAMAVVYTVGGSAGWDFAPTASYYSDWASENIFLPGDKLSFRYDPSEHNVQQVNMSDYATCNTLNPIFQYQSGNDLIALEKPGTYGFICGFAGHCEGGGMLIKLVVTESGTSPPPPPPPQVPLHPPPNHPPPPPVPLHPPPYYSPPPPPSKSLPPPPPPPLLVFPPAPATSPNPGPPAPAPKPPLTWPPPPVLASPPPAHPHNSHSKAPSRPSPTRNSHGNQTYESPTAPGAPPPLFLAAPPILAPAPSNYAPTPLDYTPAPAPFDFDSDTAQNSPRFSRGFTIVTSFVIPGAVIFW